MGRRAAIGALAWLIAAAGPPEPAGLWAGAMESDTPATLAGATVVEGAAAARDWIAAHKAAVVDVSSAPVKPAHMAPGMVWLPSAHQDLPGSVWLAGAGRAVLQPERAAAYVGAVSAVAGAPPGRAVLVYCHPHCWGSWNAAKALVQAGYKQVAWFPGGIEAWARAGYPLRRTRATAY